MAAARAQDAGLRAGVRYVTGEVGQTEVFGKRSSSGRRVGLWVVSLVRESLAEREYGE